MPDSAPKLMGAFFDSVSSDYDDVHTSHIDKGDEYHVALSDPVVSTNNRISILDIGCGTGLELSSILPKVPNAHFHCIDLSQKLLEQLKDRLSGSTCTYSVYQGSYLDCEYPLSLYEYTIASATLHHLTDKEKLRLFPKLLRSLKGEGVLIIGDWYASYDDVQSQLEAYYGFLSDGLDVTNGRYHLDIPTTRGNEQELLRRSGFTSIEVIWESFNFSIVTARKAPI